MPMYRIKVLKEIFFYPLGPFNVRERSPTKEDCYVGRPSKWGNPFKLSRHSRSSAIEKFAEHYSSSGLKDHIDELVGCRLFCHCAPLPCHADFLVKASNKIVIK